MAKLIRNERVIMGTPSHMDASSVTYNNETVQKALDDMQNPTILGTLAQKIDSNHTDIYNLYYALDEIGEEFSDGYRTFDRLFSFSDLKHYKIMRIAQHHPTLHTPDNHDAVVFVSGIDAIALTSAGNIYYASTENPTWEDLMVSYNLAKKYWCKSFDMHHREDIDGFTLTDNIDDIHRYVVAFSKKDTEPILHIIETNDGGETWQSVAQAEKKIPVSERFVREFYAKNIAIRPNENLNFKFDDQFKEGYKAVYSSVFLNSYGDYCTLNAGYYDCDTSGKISMQDCYMHNWHQTETLNVTAVWQVLWVKE